MKKLIGTALVAFVFTLVPLPMNAAASDAPGARPHLQMRKAIQVASAKKSRKHRHRHHKRAGRKPASSAA